MTYPLMSVAIPAYNHADYIEACLASVCAQTYPELEIVLVDDGSTDDTLSRAKAFLDRHASRFRRIEVYSRPNRGVSATSNECISASRGEWVHLLGSDDTLLPDKVMREWRAIQEWGDPQLALVYADVEDIDHTGRGLNRHDHDRPSPGPDHKAYEALFLGNPVINPTVALRREAFLKIGGFDETLALEDWDCWLRLSAEYPIARVPEVLACYRRHGSQTSRNQARMLHAMMLTFGKFLMQHGDLIPSEIRRRSFRKNLHRLFRWARKNRPSLLPFLFKDVLTCQFLTPQAENYFRYAKAIEPSLHKPIPKITWTAKPLSIVIFEALLQADDYHACLLSMPSFLT